MTYGPKKSNCVAAARRLSVVAVQAMVVGGMVTAFTTPNLDPQEVRRTALQDYLAAEPLESVSVDRLVRASVRMPDGPANLEQVHLSRDGSPLAVSVRIGSVAARLAPSANADRRVTLPASQLRFHRLSGRLLLDPDANNPEHTALQEIPALRPQPISVIAPSRMVGARIVDTEGSEMGRVAEIHFGASGEPVSVRMQRQDRWGRLQRDRTVYYPADCVAFVALTRTLVADDCEALPASIARSASPATAPWAHFDTACMPDRADLQVTS